MKISVAMTTFNGKDYLVQQLDSIRTQTVAPQEVVIVDDCSTDGTIELISEYIKNYQLEHWKLIVNRENVGWRKNFRKALSFTSGEIVFLADQDDIWNKTKVEETVLQFLNEKNAEVIVTNYDVLYDGRKERVRIKNINKDDRTLKRIKFTYRTIYVLRPGCTFAIKRSILDMMRQFDDPIHAHDCIIWNLAIIRNSLYIFNRKLIYFRRHINSASTPVSGLSRERRASEIRLAEDLSHFLIKVEKHVNSNYFYSHKLQRIVNFLKKRREIILDGNILQLLMFQFKSFYFYPTLRNLLSDILVFLMP
ncbi:glycosyltransferase [Streptococcus suis]